jgi:nicotinamide-nucleotide amidase
MRQAAAMHDDALTAAAADVAKRLIARDQSLAVAESSAGGLISSALLAVPGASAFYRGGVVIYTLDGAQRLLGDTAELPAGVRGSSQPFSAYLARTVTLKLDADWGIGETGAAGPSGNRYGDPAGYAWLSIAGPNDILRSEHALTGSDDRAANMQTFAATALRVLAAALASD